MNLLQRKPTRLKGYDYGSAGAYFITICTKNRQCVLSSIVGEGLAPPVVRLTHYGEIAEAQICLLTSRFPSASVEKYVIMPNHIHLILRLQKCTKDLSPAGGASPSPTVSTIIGVLKSIVARSCKCGTTLFQRSFHDHIIRNSEDYRRIWEYIDSNPAKWAEDCFYNQHS